MNRIQMIQKMIEFRRSQELTQAAASRALKVEQQVLSRVEASLFNGKEIEVPPIIKYGYLKYFDYDVETGKIRYHEDTYSRCEITFDEAVEILKKKLGTEKLTISL